MKNILVPTDFSDCARHATEVALQIARKSGAEIHFYHILSSSVDWTHVPKNKEGNYPEIKAQIAYAQAELNSLVKKATSQGIKAQQFLAFNENPSRIGEHIISHHHDFMVMGSYGASGVKEFFIGSNTQHIVRMAKCPVLAVKQQEKFQVKNIVFASNFEEDVYEPFKKVLDFANVMDAQIHLLYVNTRNYFEDTRTSNRKMKKFMEHCPNGNCTMNIYNAREETEGILHFVEDGGADVIAMTTHGRKGFSQFFIKSITESLVNHSKIPVLSVNVS